MEPHEGSPMIEFSRIGLLRMGSALPGTPKDVCRTQITKKKKKPANLNNQDTYMSVS